MNEIIEKTKEWLEKADRDLKSAKILLYNELYDYSLFHSQQAIEKYLKAFITYKNIPLNKIHDISLLIEYCMKMDTDFKYLYNINADKLYPIGIEIRYPVKYIVTEEDAKEAIDIAEKVREFIYKKLNIDNNI
ncbi:hypothetical protein MJ1_0064 [Nanobdella aerobiophila]|uniref:HEPN domain-containing protein n=1 Tax=Nanobdella aerobiophila TaxID=2586965 RepID=A0A915WR74_9ARCH|nr:HEPN domain-containing protein [Nanobdella aerobiophila]BBL45243.1 hypothetical protein MJ1_0064 [Nanobdella aerobiophila]